MLLSRMAAARYDSHSAAFVCLRYQSFIKIELIRHPGRKGLDSLATRDHAFPAAFSLRGRTAHGDDSHGSQCQKNCSQ